MPIDEKLLLYCLANTFSTTLDIEISDDTKKFMKGMAKNFAKLSVFDKMYYTKYSMQLAQSLMEYLPDISLFELNTDEESEVIHDFRIVWKKNSVVHISMAHDTINVRDLIPDKLMKICKYKRNTNMCKNYTAAYHKLNDRGYSKIKKNSKYSELSDKTKEAVLVPFRDLFLATLSKKRKHAADLYSHLFTETDRIVLRLYKNRFTIYDFGKELDSAESYRMKLSQDDEIMITFNNKAKFLLSLQTNASEIREHLSLKFHTTFKNMDDFFAVDNVTI